MSTRLPKVARLSSNVIRVLGLNPGPFTLQGTNTYLIGSGKKRILLDTGEPQRPDYVHLLRTVLDEQKCTIDKIVLSHWHQDHVGGLSAILSKLQLEKDTQIYKIKNDVKDMPDQISYTYVNDQFQIQTEDGLTLRLYETPGHTEDHLVIHLEDDNSLFSGDCILGEGSTVFEDLLTYLKSLQRIRNLNPSRIYPGHGPVIDDPATKVEEYINHRLQRERQILDALATNPECAVDVQDIVAKLYPDLSENLVLGAISNIYKHLVKLIKEDRVVMIGAMPINHEQLKSSEPPRFWLKQKKTY